MIKLKKKKRKLKKITVLSFTILLIIIISAIILKINLETSFTNKLIKRGYSKAEAKEINKIVNVKNHKLILSYNKNIASIITAQDYNDNNLENYLNYQKKYNCPNINDTIFIVNNNYDNLKYSKTLITYLKEKYFIIDNYKRYKKYHKLYPKLDISEIIGLVNANADKQKYIDTKKTDLSDKSLILVNKYNYLEKDYEPTDLVTLSDNYNTGKNNQLCREAANAFMKMADAALVDNIILKNASGYRSYKYQKQLYNDYINRDGKIAADTYSARPGFSEHQTGLATDINEISDSFETSDAFKWLIDNAYKYGFILRFPKNKENITGYKYESWHYRYVGMKEAKIMVKENLTLEEYYAFYIENQKK